MRGSVDEIWTSGAWTHLEGKAHLAGYELLLVAEDDRVPDLFALAVPFHLAIQGGGLPRLRMGIVWTHGVHLMVSRAAERGKKK